MKYRIREGVILRNICDEWMLIAVGEAADHCLYVRHINDSFAWYFKLIEEGLSRDDIIDRTVEYYDASKEDISKDFDILTDQLYELGYLIDGKDDSL